MAKYLGLDYGLENTGAAISDPAGKIAFPFGVFRLAAYPSRAALLADLANKATLAGVEAVVLGLPLFPDGEENLMCRRVRNFGARLLRRLPLPQYYISEIYSTLIAEMDLREAGVKKRRHLEVIDQQAACRILQSFLDGHTGSESP